jgi:hypothetical protein
VSKIVIEYVRGSQHFTPDGTGGGTLTWRERVIRPGFRPNTRERSLRKEAVAAESPGPAQHIHIPAEEPVPTVAASACTAMVLWRPRAA